MKKKTPDVSRIDADQRRRNDEATKLFARLYNAPQGRVTESKTKRGSK